MMKALTLPDGRTLNYTVRQSARAKYLRMQLHPNKGLVVTQPAGIGSRQVHDWVNSQLAWVATTLSKIERETPPATTDSPLPERLELLASGESLRVIYTPTARKNIGLDYVAHHTLTLSGAISDPEHCQFALRHWLRGYAQLHLGKQLQQLAEETGLRYTRCSVKGQQTRWGSCSSSGNINLNYKLMLLPPEWVRYTLIHELCHTVEMNHSKRFWALVTQFSPGYEAIHAAMKGAMGRLPGWVNGA
ncbi:M48 family metallopeptidase [Thiothrix litoralis]|uniref:M48 family metallopeptidase n=1 Tax=Thiothrix litoralis TaxID=2891210 RepID=A0ABX7WUG1_9GAMM|nr:SprT family zinc-dependent metalloprotease [Thiothrix litoralis]QTR46108.1 M48 family metallopeptidase [Thiothrix litoralis]